MTTEQHDLLDEVADRMDVSKHSIMLNMTIAGATRLWKRVRGDERAHLCGDQLLALEAIAIATSVDATKHADYPIESWRREVAESKTILGYADWVTQHQAMEISASVSDKTPDRFGT
jgi:hypothetical protein